jgi:hypothetical protein
VPSGSLAASSVGVSENTRVTLTYTGGVDGQDYEAVCTVTLNGASRVGRQRVPVRKR